MKQFTIFTFSFMVYITQAQTIQDPIYINASLNSRVHIAAKNTFLSQNFLDINFTTPAIQLGKKMKWYHAVYYRNSNFDFSDSTSTNISIIPNLHDIRYSSIFRYSLCQSIEFVFLPRILIRSSLSQPMNEKDFIPYLVFLANFSPYNQPNLKIGLGLALNNDFSPNAIIPTGTLFYNNKKFKIEIAYPNAQFLFKKSKDFEFGLFANIDGSISRVSPISFGSEVASYFKSFQIIMAPTFSHRIYNNFFAHLKIGYLGFRTVQHLDANYNSLSETKQNPAPSLYTKLGISYRLQD